MTLRCASRHSTILLSAKMPRGSVTAEGGWVVGRTSAGVGGYLDENSAGFQPHIEAMVLVLRPTRARKLFRGNTIRNKVPTAYAHPAVHRLGLFSISLARASFRADRSWEPVMLLKKLRLQ